MAGKIRVGITIGDPSGIGPAITLKATDELKGLADFIVIGDAWVLHKSQVKIQNPKSKIFKLVELLNLHHSDF
ncbi:MAG: hypothetical protein Q8N85_04165 [Candidatus Omnitrophota bacterium]|nr:hypothetical protein [Candidatus Omnitrophota bacterium]